MHDGGGFSGGHHGGGFSGHHHHGGGFAGHHHNQSDQNGFFVPMGDVQPPRTRGLGGGARPTAARYVAFGAFMVVIVVVLLIVAH